MRPDVVGSVRSGAVARRGLPMDGAAVLDGVIDELAPHAKTSKCAIVWDVDGTLVDTRPRMLDSVHAYGRRDVTLDQFTSTAPHSDDVAAQFALEPVRFLSVWKRDFWRGFERDRSIDPVISRLRRAHRLKIKVIICTGRNVEICQATILDLKRRGVPFDTVMCKQAHEKTPAAKAGRFEDLLRANIRIGAFVTDCAAEINAVQRIPGLKARCILVAGSRQNLDRVPDIRAHVMPVELSPR